MKDLTQGSVARHLLHMSTFMMMSMALQTLYLLLDLKWVGYLGKEAIAAVGVAGSLNMIVLALTQMLSVGAITLISHAAGRKDQAEAELVFNQSFVMSLLATVGLGTVSFALRGPYCHALAADSGTAELASAYLFWFIPALALQFPMVGMGAALRANGIVKPTVILQVASVVLNGVLAPLFIFGIGPFPRMGAPGAALATLIAVVAANVGLFIYFEKKYHYLRFRRALMQPQFKIWRRMFGVGVPAGSEFILVFVYMVLIFGIIRGFGPAAQAGFGVGSRIMQALFLPVVALAFAASPVIGQNFGGRQAARVRQAVYSAIGIASVMMFALTLLAFFAPGLMIRAFSDDPEVIHFGSGYLRIVAFNFVAAGVVFVSSSVFQGIGNTWPPLASSFSRLLIFFLPALYISRLPGFQIYHVWYLSAGSQILQACLNLLLLRREMRKRLNFAPVDDFVPGGVVSG